MDRLNKRQLMFLMPIFLMVFIPWKKIFGARFPDYEAYIGQYAALELNQIGNNFISNEFGWQYLVLASKYFEISATTFFLFVSIVTSLIILQVLIKKTNFSWALFCFFNPIIIDLINSQLRTAIMISLVLYAQFSIKRVSIKYALLALSASIHILGLFIFCIVLVHDLVTKICNKEEVKDYLIGSIGIFAIALILVILNMDFFLQFIGDTKRKALLNLHVGVGVKIIAIYVIFFLTIYMQFFQLKLVTKEGYIALVLIESFILLSTFGLTNSFRLATLAYPFIAMTIYTLKGRLALVKILFLIIATIIS